MTNVYVFQCMGVGLWEEEAGVRGGSAQLNTNMLCNSCKQEFSAITSYTRLHARCFFSFLRSSQKIILTIMFHNGRFCYNFFFF